jgi:hypothetical protein
MSKTSLDTLRHNIGRLCMDGNGIMYMIVDVQLPSSYKIYDIKTGSSFYLDSGVLNNQGMVRWLTPPKL